MRSPADSRLLASAGRAPRLIAVLTLAAASACTAKSDSARSSDTAMPATASAPAATDSANGMAGMSGMSDSSGKMGGMGNMGGMAMTGDADHDFLRMMSDHHKGLIAMAHETVEGKTASAATRADAKKLDGKQDVELDSMVTMLEKSYKDPYDPKVMPDNKAMLDSLTKLSGKAYDRQFYHDVVMHHQQAIKMIDDYLPKAKDAKLKAMAQRMKSDQQREITEMQQKAKALD
jgi:Domain of unknown function (DUF305)